MADFQGTVTQVLGNVVDVEFPQGHLPDIYDAVEVPREGKDALVLEVELHLGGNAVRTVAMDSTDGLARGASAIATGQPIAVPVGAPTLGRIFNVLGRPIDMGEEVPADVERRPIHADAPSFEEQSPSIEVFETGMKVIDLVAPMTKGGENRHFWWGRSRQDGNDSGIDQLHRHAARWLVGVCGCGRTHARRHRSLS